MMPTREMIPENVLFVMDGEGKYRKIASEVPVVSSIEDDCAHTACIEINALAEFGLTFDSKTIKSLLLMANNYENNNWRKMHGYPMIRNRKVRNAERKRR